MKEKSQYIVFGLTLLLTGSIIYSTLTNKDVKEYREQNNKEIIEKASSSFNKLEKEALKSDSLYKNNPTQTNYKKIN